MKFSKFIYLYSSTYHHNNVKCALARENWGDTDGDVKYARYIQDYIKCRNILIEKDEHIIEEVLKKYLKKRSNEVYDTIFKFIINELRIYYNVSDDEYDDIKLQLSTLKDDNFNFEYLKKAREIEEKFHQKKLNRGN